MLSACGSCAALTPLILSTWFALLLAPFAALAWVWGRRAVALLTGAGIVLTHVEFPSRYFDLINERTDVVAIVAARNAVLLLALVVLLAALRRLAAAPARSRPRAAAASR